MIITCVESQKSVFKTATSGLKLSSPAKALAVSNKIVPEMLPINNDTLSDFLIAK